jgi:acyl-CoA synthetase (AMP-forming)/AMP-acid ligase II
MTRGPGIDIVFPENINLTTYYLEDNIAHGRGEKIAVYYQDETYAFNQRSAQVVRECVVLGVKDAYGLAKTKVLSVLNNGFEPSEALVEELKEHCKQNMAPFKASRLVELLAKLQKTG